MKKYISFLCILVFVIIIYIYIGKLDVMTLLTQISPEFVNNYLDTPDGQHIFQDAFSFFRACLSYSIVYGATHMPNLKSFVVDIITKNSEGAPEISFDIPTVTIPRKVKPKNDLPEIVLTEGKPAVYVWVRMTNEGDKSIIACEINEFQFNAKRISPNEIFEFYFKFHANPSKIRKEPKNKYIRKLHRKWVNWRETTAFKLKISIQNNKNEFFHAKYMLKINHIKQNGRIHRLTRFRKE